MAILILVLLIIPQLAASLTFNFTQFSPQNKNADIVTIGDASITSKEGLRLTHYEDGSETVDDYRVGRATYVKPLHLWDKNSGELASFDTSFNFVISKLGSEWGDGLTFFLAENNSVTPVARFLGLPLYMSSLHSDDVEPKKVLAPFVAVEFDTVENLYIDPPNMLTHVGIDINNLSSVAYQAWSIPDSGECGARIKYDSRSKNISVFVTDFQGNTTQLYYIVDLREVLPEWVIFGFTATTGPDFYFQKNNVQSWSFSSLDLKEVYESVDVHKSAPTVNPVKGKNWTIEIAVGVIAMMAIIFIVIFLLWRRKKNIAGEEPKEDVVMNKDFEIGTGARRFSYQEILEATDGFAETNKLGEGGFGGVYKGFLKDIDTYVAVKRVSRTSGQGLKEYMSEVKIISRLRHKNLVELKGWCHEKNELLLVYELMENGSLDFHLFKENGNLLTWDKRYRIAHGLASALIYLQEDCKEWVLHRDIKSSNVMLDLNFNPKLGDFGLAKLVNREKGSQTTMLAGTVGYMAPEYVMEGKASKESDVFSFGIVALEISCGRQPIKKIAQGNDAQLLEWVWNLYGTDSLLEAADPRLGSDFVEEELKRLMIVGLWCAHPQASSRPSMRQAMHVLNFEASVPVLPSKLPMLKLFEPPTSSWYSGNSSNTLSSNLTTPTSPSPLLFH